MAQRYYDPMLGVFLSADPVTAYSSPITQFHRYRYANNNPYTLIDPDGRRANGDDQKTTGSHLRQSEVAQAMLGNGPARGAATQAQLEGLNATTYQDVRTGSREVESWFTMNDQGEITHKSQQGCNGDDQCDISRKFIPPGTTLIGHTHVYRRAPGRSRPSLESRIIREFPGPGDGGVVAAGYLGAVYMPSGARYMISGQPPRAIYLGGGDPGLGAFIEQHWVPHMAPEQTLMKAKEYLEAR